MKNTKQNQLIQFAASHEFEAYADDTNVYLRMPWINVNDKTQGEYTLICNSFSVMRKALGY